MIKNIIFDFDGVIVDSEVLVSKAYSRYFNSSGYLINEHEFFKFAGKKTNEVIAELSTKFSINNKEKFYNDIIKLTANIYSNELTPINGVLNYLNNTKMKLFIGSNSVKNRILEGLKKVELIKFFEEKNIYSFDMVEKPKPYPDIYLKIIKDNNLIKEETIILEDSSVGIKAGVASGIKVIGLTAGGHWKYGRKYDELYKSGAYKVINNFKQLDAILNQL